MSSYIIMVANSHPRHWLPCCARSCLKLWHAIHQSVCVPSRKATVIIIRVSVSQIWSHYFFSGFALHCRSLFILYLWMPRMTWSSFPFNFAGLLTSSVLFPCEYLCHCLSESCLVIWSVWEFTGLEAACLTCIERIMIYYFLKRIYIQFFIPKLQSGSWISPQKNHKIFLLCTEGEKCRVQALKICSGFSCFYYFYYFYFFVDYN